MAKYEMLSKTTTSENGTNYYTYTYKITKEDGTTKTKTIKRKYTPRNRRKKYLHNQTNQRYKLDERSFVFG